jgi:energy-coupling factor transporter ATP-binding protein EcfA2
MQTTPDTLLVMGPNGSGKTTLLKAIGHLWHLLRLFLEGRSYTQAPRFSLFYNTQLAAMALLDFLPEQKFWIYQGHEDEVRPFLQEHQDEHKIGAVRVSLGNPERYKIHYLPPGHSSPQELDLSHSFMDDLRDRYVKNRLGGRVNLANMILLENEKRTLERIIDPPSDFPP